MRKTKLIDGPTCWRDTGGVDEAFALSLHAEATRRLFRARSLEESHDYTIVYGIYDPGECRSIAIGSGCYVVPKRQEMKKCFVISPIGREGSATREHADDVFDYIIRPAMEAREIDCRRSDHLHEPGKISEQMFREIFESDVCVALLTEHNPNVFYELALAQAWNRPVIILIENHEEIPFDIRDIRCVNYDLKPRNLFEKVFVNRLIAHLDSLEQLGWKVPSPFGDIGIATPSDVEWLTPRFYDRYTRFGTSETWLATFAETSRRCDLLSLSLDSWKNRSGFAELMQTKAATGCQVRLLQMHPNNPMLIDHGSGTKAAEYTVPTIQLSCQFYRNLSMRFPEIQFRQMRRGCTHSRIIILDQGAFFSPYFYGLGSSPLWQCDADSVLYQSLSTEFETLWSMNDDEIPSRSEGMDH